MNRARIAGIFYLITFVTGTIALLDRSRVGMVAGLVAGISYLFVTWLFYGLFKPVNRAVSLLAAIVSVGGVVAGMARLPNLNPLVFFGFYCLLIGYLLIRSTFAPNWLGALLVCAGAGWLTFVSPALARSLNPYNFAPGLIGEGALTLWLLVAGGGASKGASPGERQSAERHDPPGRERTGDSRHPIPPATRSASALRDAARSTAG